MGIEWLSEAVALGSIKGSGLADRKGGIHCYDVIICSRHLHPRPTHESQTGCARRLADGITAPTSRPAGPWHHKKAQATEGWGVAREGGPRSVRCH